MLGTPHPPPSAASGGAQLHGDPHVRKQAVGCRGDGFEERLERDAARDRNAETPGDPCEARVISAHRSPEVAFEYASSAEQRGLEVIIAAAGGAAHLAGVLAGKTIIPVLGVPMTGWALNGLDALLSTVMMPAGVPVGTLAIGKAGAINAALLAAGFMGNTHPEIRERLKQFRKEQTAKVMEDTYLEV
ncbi:MAG: 5-(carboxyamino)imidazole ribonucleotide mutase [Polyangiaceae bacterium]